MNPSQFLRLANALPEALILITADGTVKAVNRAAAKLLDAEPNTWADRPLAEFLSNSAEQLKRHLRLWSRSRQPLPAPLTWRGDAKAMRGWRCQGFLLTPEDRGESAYIVLRCTPGRAPAGDFLVLNRELERQHRTLRSLMESREELAVQYEKVRVTLHSIGDAVITTDGEGKVEYLNPIAEQLTGWSSEEAVGRPLPEVFNIINEFTRRTAPNPVSRCLEEGRIVGLANHTVLVARDGTEYIIEDSASPIRNRRGMVLGAVLVFRDVTGDRLARRQLEYLAQRDTLSGLYNRHYFEQQLEQAVYLSQRGRRCHAMLYIDLDQFKIVNDTAGHAVGDELLAEVARLFARRARQGDVLARLGGDEFGALLNDVTATQAQRIAEDFLKAMAGFRFVRHGKTYDISASIGVAAIDGNTYSSAEVLRNADIACYVAKRAGRNSCHLYSESDEADLAAVGEMHLVNEVKEALAGGRMKLYFQPINHIADGATAFYEVLVRMVGEDGEIKLPSAFISAAERFGLMPQIDRWVVTRALEVLAGFHRRGRKLELTVNLSGASMGDPCLLADIKAQLGATDADPSCLIFEVTETAAVVQIEKAGTFMRELGNLGCRFALDDFGTGFSSFAYLKYLPVDFLKIDGTFVRDMLSDPVDQAMVRSINQIAHSLGKVTIAEFVESSEILAQVKDFGVDMAQGFHIGRPSPTIDGFDDSDL